MYENPGVRECAFNFSFGGAEQRTLRLCKNPFPEVHESGGDLFLHWSFEVRKKIFFTQNVGE